MTSLPQLILIHGWGSSANVWDSLQRTLDKDFEIQTIELPGHGVSELRSNDLVDLAEEVMASLRQKLTGKAIWLGWSLGGLLAMQVALLKPEVVRSLLLVSATPSFIQHGDWQSAMTPEEFNNFYQSYLDDPARALQRFVSLQAQGDANARKVMKTLKQTQTGRIDNLLWGLDNLREANLGSEMSNISVPVSALYGQRDALVPVAVADELSALHDLDVETWQTAGHAPFLSDPERFADWVRKSTVNGRYV